MHQKGGVDGTVFNGSNILDSVIDSTVKLKLKTLQVGRCGRGEAGTKPKKKGAVFAALDGTD